MAPNDKTGRRAGYGFFLVFMVLAAGIVASGFFFYGNYKRRFRAEIDRQLSTIAELKVNELVDWRAERAGDASLFYNNPSFSGLVRRFFDRPNDPAARDQLRTWLSHVQAAYDYNRLFLLDAQGVERISAPDTPEKVALHLIQQAPEILRSGRVTFMDFHRDAPDGPIHMSLLVPILDGGDNSRPIGILVLRIDPQRYLYPFINQWPAPSRTAETLIVRQDGNDALYLNELRFQENTALNLRIPLGSKDVPAVKAVLGQEGVVEGVDYRGAPVIAALRAVPDSPWFLVARMDIAEAYAPLRERLWVMIALFGSLLLGAGGATGFIWRHQRERFYREKYVVAEALKASEVRYRRLFEAAQDGILILDAETGVIVDANPFLCELLGFSSAQLMGKFIWEMGSLKDVAANKEKFQELQNGQYVRFENLPLEAAGGREIFVEFVSNVYEVNKQKVIQCNIRDITERKLAEDVLALQKRINDVFLTTLGDRMYDELLKIIQEVMESPFGVFGYMDEAGALVVPSMTGDIRDKRQVLPKNITFPPETWGDSGWARAVREKKANYSNEPSTKTPGGGVSFRRHISLPIMDQGELIGLFQVANRDTDYSEEDIRKLETIAGHVAPILSARLQTQRHQEEIQKRNDELIRFTYTVSHDLKSPLVTIRTFLGYLEQDIRKPDVPVVDKDLAYIRNAADKMARLLDELLELSRIGRKVNPPTETPLQEIVKDALDLVAGRIVGRRAQVRVTKEPIVLTGDRLRLVEVFQNLVDNAVKFMGARRAPLIEIGAEQVGEEMVLFVRDNGIGIDPQHMPKLFNLFEKLDPNTEGTGIGLALVRRIVEVHGGRIWAESEGPGRGATFRFTLAKTRRQPQ